jgi:hypothetical protein
MNEEKPATAAEPIPQTTSEPLSQPEAQPASPTTPEPAAQPVPQPLSQPAVKVTLPREVLRVFRIWPDWIFGLLASMALGLATGAFLYWNTVSPVHDPMKLLVSTVLTAVADASLTNQLAAEPDWAIKVLSSGGDPARMLRVRNQLLYIIEAGFAFGVGGLIVLLTGQHHWVVRNWPIIAELPLAPIAAGNLASVLFPCPFMRLRHRMQALSTWPRWSAYIGIPFALTSLGSLMVLAVPAYVENRVVHAASRMHHRPTWLSENNIHFATWLVAVPILNLLVWAVALKAADALARLRRRHLVDLMTKHTALVEGFDDLTLWQAVRMLPRNFKRVPADARDAANAEIEELRVIGGHIDKGLEHALAHQAARIRAKRAREAGESTA